MRRFGYVHSNIIVFDNKRLSRLWIQFNRSILLHVLAKKSDLLFLTCSFLTDGSPSVRPVEVVTKGLVIVLPIITEELLKVGVQLKLSIVRKKYTYTYMYNEWKHLYCYN